MGKRMKNWTLKFRAVDRDNFEKMRSGTKAFETRAATVKYEPIAAGDTLTFVCGKASFVKRVAKKHHFKTIGAMVKKIPFKKIMPDVESVAEMRKRYARYPGYTEKIRAHGLFAFELK